MLIAAALQALRRGEVKRLVLTRPVVEAGEHLGFLPGDLEDKIDPYLRPLFDAMSDLLGPAQARRMRELDIVEIAPLAFMRGRTLARSFVILDEAQNTLPIQIKTFLTRIGQGSKFIVNGDLLQTDIHHENGLEDSIKRLVGVRGLGMSRFTSEDIVRHPIVKDVLSRYAPDWKVSHDSAEATMSNYIENGQAFAIKVRDKILKHYN